MVAAHGDMMCALCMLLPTLMVCCPVLRKFWLIVFHNVTCAVPVVLIEYVLLVVQVWMPKDRQGRAKNLSTPWLFH
jgi:hypothetical protein